MNTKQFRIKSLINIIIFTLIATSAFAIQTKKSDFNPDLTLIEDENTRKVLEEIMTIIQSIREDTYKDFDESFRDYSSNVGFGQSDVAANQTAVALSVTGQAGNTEFTAAKDGYIMGISVSSNDARTGGTLTADVTVNGTAQTVQAILNGTNTTYHYSTVSRGSKVFAAGDRIGVKITTDATWAPTTADIIVNVFMTYN